MNTPKYGVINEIGDLGLGFQEITEQEQNTLNENKESEEKKQ